MAKDKIIGLIVMLLGILIAVVYTMGSIVDLYFQSPNWGNNPTWATDIFGFLGSFLDYKLFTVLPLWIMVLLIAVIAIWIGYSMLTVFEQFAGFKLNAGTRSVGRVGRGVSC